MARPCKAKRVCAKPSVEVFGPLDQETDGKVELLSDDKQEDDESAVQMGVARTTVQAVYNTARRKIADCIVNGRGLEIRGGNYQICPNAAQCCGRNCGKRQCHARRCENKSGGCQNENCGNI